MNTNKQAAIMARNGWIIKDMADDGSVMCEVSHPNGVVSVYIALDGSVMVEEGDDFSGYEMVPLSDSFLNGLIK